MKKILEIVSYLSLVLLVAAPLLFYAGKVSLDTNKMIMLVASVVWFASSMVWMGRKENAED